MGRRGEGEGEEREEEREEEKPIWGSFSLMKSIQASTHSGFT